MALSKPGKTILSEERTKDPYQTAFAKHVSIKSWRSSKQSRFIFCWLFGDLLSIALGKKTGRPLSDLLLIAHDN